MSSFAGMISARSRARKFDLFMELVGPSENDTVLDVGVDPGGYGDDLLGVGTTNFFEAMYPWPRQITALGLHDGVAFTKRHPGVQYVQGDGTNLPFASFGFDVVFSNAVIEHVGDWDAQRRFANEIRRVAPDYFVTTPNKHFPVETHTRIPFVHWLPKNLRDRIYVKTGKAWAQTNFHLLSASDMRVLFPDARIINLGMTIVATNSPATI